MKVVGKSVGEKLVNLRAEKTQREVAEAVGISISALAMYESGQRIPRDEVKVRLARYFGASIEEIFFARNVH
ncbi:helix-turn-helix domain-containing protein [Negativicoccus succinicivorans]|uniref:helix-turn-helix domain-containing protein n=1 Tax=Negativicoccus succinicivorans TaxID=620903 RepID=UPI000764251F|nr:helix-turn-helix transcriptional regulator [Negativicoccus succinicivorans]